MPLIGVGAQISVQFGIVETLKKIFKARYADSEGILHWKYSLLSGAIAGIPSAIVLVPLDHSRFRVALIKEKGIGSFKMTIQIYQNYGLKKLYSGFNVTAIRESFLGVYFGVYDFCMRFFKKNN